MAHPDSAYTDPGYARTDLDELRREWMTSLEARTPRVSPKTIIKYDSVLRHFIAYLTQKGHAPELAALTRVNVDGWVTSQRRSGLADYTIHTRLSALKAFSGKYVWGVREMTHYNLLARVTNQMPPDKPKMGLTAEETEQILACYIYPTITDVRDRAILATCISTGLRFAEVMSLKLTDLDRLSGRIEVLGKGEKVRRVRVSPRVLKYLRLYLADRPQTECDQLWVTERGFPFTYHGAYAIVRTARRKSGVRRLTWHLMRHGFAQQAFKSGAHQGMVQDMLGHASPAMTRRYLGTVQQQQAAEDMPKYSAI
jgi:site-specific recombinase XerD